MEPLVNEFIQYVIKFVILGAIAIVGVICGAKYKKNKLAKETSASEGSADETIQ